MTCDVCMCTGTIVTVFALIAAAYYYIRNRYLYWERKNVPYVKPTFPWGNLTEMGKLHQSRSMQNLYNKFVGKDVIMGIFFFIKPAVLVLDPELVKNIMIRDFNYFHNRGTYYNEKDDPLSAHLFSLEGNKWKVLRAKLTPTFTTGKMKMMFETILKIADEMQTHLESNAERGDVINVKDICARYTTDVIGSCAFGLDCNSIKDPNAEFFVQGSRFLKISPLMMMKIFLAASFRPLAVKLGFRIVNPDVSKFMINVVRETINYRKENNVVKNDFMQLMIELYDKGEEGEGLASIEEVAAQAFLFFVAGFETSSTTQSFCLYELGRNTDIQDKVRKEIEDTLKKHDGKVTYEMLQEMKYLDMVISETLRMYPTVGNLIRKADRDYEVDEKKYIIEKDTLVFIPVYAMHMDPNIFPEPEVFDPERFSDANKGRHHPFAYLPFGEGPRVCIGMRFGKMQTQLGLIKFLQKYKVSHTEKTPKEVVFEPNGPVTQMLGGYWLKIEKL